MADVVWCVLTYVTRQAWQDVFQKLQLPFHIQVDSKRVRKGSMNKINKKTNARTYVFNFRNDSIHPVC